MACSLGFPVAEGLQECAEYGVSRLRKKRSNKPTELAHRGSWMREQRKRANVGEAKEGLRVALDKLERGDLLPSIHTYAHLLQQCSSSKALSLAKRLHHHILSTAYGGHRFLANLLVRMYANCGSLQDARSVFDTISHPNIYSWNIMLAAYTLHGRLDEARAFFHQMPHRDSASWTTMITAYAQNGQAAEALEFFSQMEITGVKPHRITFISALDACASLVALAKGKCIHERLAEAGIELDVSLGTALVNMYGKCASLDDARRVFHEMQQTNMLTWTALMGAYAENGNVDDARHIFDKMPKHDIVSWTAMIKAYTRHGRSKDALELFEEMISQGIALNQITLTTILDACASLAALVQGKKVHSIIVEHGFGLDLTVGTALVNMYGKCGTLDDARRVFDSMPLHDTISWNVMIASYSQNGLYKDALKLFHQMKLQNVKPNKSTFTSILFACSHIGLLEDAWLYFFSMSRDHDIIPTVEHYGCMVDLIGRIAQLDEAEDLIRNLPFQAGTVLWMVLLGACRIHGQVDRGIRTARHVIKLEPRNSSSYILLSNIYAADNRWNDVEKVRMVMEQRGLKE